MVNLYQFFPNLEPEEMSYIQGFTKDMDENQLMMYANVYNSRRRDPQVILLTALAGFLGVAGIQRFLVDQIGMGIAFLLTGGFCMIGTIIDLINYKKLANEYNFKMAQQSAMIVRGSTGGFNAQPPQQY